MAMNGINLDPNLENDEQRAAATEQMFARADRIMKGMQTPQAIRDLPCFDGDAVKLHSFIKSVENLMPFIEALDGTPFHAVWTQSIRAKITGEADRILEIYGTPADWNEIKNNLIAYYNDKRDPVTLTRELFQLQQNGTIENFYGKVQNLLSLLINHTNINTNEDNLKHDRVNTHQENALQVFLAGLREPIGGNVRARQPKTLKEGFDAAIEERNFLSRSGLNQKPFSFQQSYLPKFPTYPVQQRNVFTPNQFYIPKLPIPNRNVFAPKPYPVPQPKPTPMEVDRPTRSRQSNYAGRHNFNNPRQPYPQPNLQQNNRNFFQPTGPPRVHVEELHYTEDPMENQEYDPYYYCYYPQPNYYTYPQPDQNYDHFPNPEKPTEATKQLAIESPPQNQPNETEKPADNLNFQMVSVEIYPT